MAHMGGARGGTRPCLCEAYTGDSAQGRVASVRECPSCLPSHAPYSDPDNAHCSGAVGGARPLPGAV